MTLSPRSFHLLPKPLLPRHPLHPTLPGLVSQHSSLLMASLLATAYYLRLQGICSLEFVCVREKAYHCLFLLSSPSKLWREFLLSSALRIYTHAHLSTQAELSQWQRLLDSTGRQTVCGSQRCPTPSSHTRGYIHNVYNVHHSYFHPWCLYTYLGSCLKIYVLWVLSQNWQIRTLGKIRFSETLPGKLWYITKFENTDFHSIKYHIWKESDSCLKQYFGSYQSLTRMHQSLDPSSSCQTLKEQMNCYRRSRSFN